MTPNDVEERLTRLEKAVQRLGEMLADLRQHGDDGDAWKRGAP